MVNLFVPLSNLDGGPALAVYLCGMITMAAIVGVIESIMARLGMLKVPRMLAGALAIAILAFALAIRFTT